MRKAAWITLLGVVLSTGVVCTGLVGLRIGYASDDLTVGSMATVTGTEGAGLRIRSGPGMRNRIVRTLAEGTVVKIFAGPVSDNDDDWYQLGSGTTATGWGLGRYLFSSSSGLVTTDQDGRRTFLAKVTAYANGVAGVPKDPRTATGTQPHWGTVAVDPKVIPLGSSLTIDGYDMVFTAEDTGSAIRGLTIDLWLPDAVEARRYGTQYREVKIVREGPAK